MRNYEADADYPDLPAGLCPSYTWEENLKNCRITDDVALPVCGNVQDIENMHVICYELGRLGFKEMGTHRCGRWRWIEFDSPEDKFSFLMSSRYDVIKKRIENFEELIPDLDAEVYAEYYQNYYSKEE